MKFPPAVLANLIVTASLLTGSAVLSGSALAADVSQPVVSDSRVKTFVYNENDVYTILTQYGYQTNIEFGKGEEIQTISVGDRVSWQIIPAGRRLFIQTMQDDAQTNLTVVTDRRAYQFDLKSTRHTKGNEDRLVYVARFYYPDEEWSNPHPVSAPVVAPATAAAPVAAASAPPSMTPSSSDAPVDSLLQPTAEGAYNFNYTYAGPDTIAPLKIFDDGQNTYFQFRQGETPTISTLAGGRETPVQASEQGGYLVVPGTASQFALRQGREVICVFNEQLRGH